MAGQRPGPVPKRSDERQGHGPSTAGEARKGVALPTRPPAADSDWHDRVKRWYNGLKKSGQARYYQQSDWEYARIAGDVLNKLYDNDFHRGAMMLAEVNRMMSNLGTTEADRRSSLRVELEAPVDEEDSTEAKAEANYLNVIQGDFSGAAAS